MIKIGLIFTNLLLLASLSLSHAQSLVDDNNVLFLKANVLYESDRYDEAVRLYNRILNDDSNFSRALFMRAKAKYALGAFKGTKNDMLDYVYKRGINVEIIEVLANTEMKLENTNNALSYYEMLHKLLPYEGKYFSRAGDIKNDSGDRNTACEYWIKGAQLGDKESTKQASSRCAYNNSIHLPSKQDQHTTGGEVIEETTVAEGTITTTEVMRDSPQEDSETQEDVIDVSVHTLPTVNVNAVREIEIDDELRIIITSGLGERKIDYFPNILMLSDRSGKVVIKICVNGSGEVISAELDNVKSTLLRSSLSSLAIRKAKEFVFMPSLTEDQCGLLVYDIDTDQ